MAWPRINEQPRQRGLVGCHRLRVSSGLLISRRDSKKLLPGLRGFHDDRGRRDAANRRMSATATEGAGRDKSNPRYPVENNLRGDGDDRI